MIDATQRKLREAKFFFGHLRHRVKKSPLEPDEVIYYLSAYLSAARSVTLVLQVQEKQKYDAWFERWRMSLGADDQDLL